jgi:predicted CxxxxCH...CXXCH cytochrome family protein
MTSTRIAVLGLAAASIVAGCDGARPLESAGAVSRCEACHGAPPPPSVLSRNGTPHPASLECSLCHATTVNQAGDLGAAHQNGTVDVSIHAVPFTTHTDAALADLASCATCHGTDHAGGLSGVSCTACHGAAVSFPDWQTNCTFCHGTRTPGWTGTPLRLAAPPQGARGETLATQPQVGAHQKHLGSGSTISDGVACTECHALPADLSHLDGVAQVAFGGLASQGNLSPGYTGGSCSATYCHGGQASTSPPWTGAMACGDCHGLPPSTGKHAIPQHLGHPCYRCHSEVATDTATPGILGTSAARALHVNGSNDVSFSVNGTWDAGTGTCSNIACHGGAGGTWR